MNFNQKTTSLDDIIEMINAMARLDFSKRLSIEISDDPIHLIAYGLNMLSEELESSVVKRSTLEEINNNLEKFTYTVAHDIKSPINSSSGIISLIEDEIKAYDNPDLKEYVKALRSINERSKRMVSGILEYSKAHSDRIKLSKINLSEVCSELSKEYALDKNICITYAPNMPTVLFNEAALFQILGNLISNAIKFNDKPFCEINIQSSERDKDYLIMVKDNGPGILEKDQKTIFDLYENLQTTKQDSTGIGLTIINKIVMQNKGNIWVESNPGKGSIFNFTILKNNLTY